MVKFSEVLFRINNPGVVAQKPARINESKNYDDLHGYFFELIERTVATHYVLSEDGDFEPTDKQFDMLEYVIEFAIANQNDPHIDQIVEQLCLDESIGSAIATAAHGIQSYFANRKTNKAATKFGKATAKLMGSEKITKSAGRAKTIPGRMRVGFEKARQPKLRKDADEKGNKFSDAKMFSNIRAKKRADLGNKIDSKIGAGVERVGNIAGRIASKFM